MNDSAKLGGFKVLKDVVRISLFPPEGLDRFPETLCRTLARNRINLPYLATVRDRDSWGVDLIVDESDEETADRLIQEAFGRIPATRSRSAVISIFPHKRNPEVSGKLLSAFADERVVPDGLASSPSAISVIVQEGSLQKASDALFEPFSFSAYRTPEDWKMAQKGKENLLKEVMASYQEKKPGVYGLEYGAGQELIQLRLEKTDIAPVGSSFKSLDCHGLRLAFLATSPTHEEGKQTLSFCLPSAEGATCKDTMGRLSRGGRIETISPVMTFSMNGPHFGDRYGIIGQLLTAFHEQEIGLLALACTVASITGVVPQEDTEHAIESIRRCFDVPSVTKRE
jgi:aspartokinase